MNTDFQCERKLKRENPFYSELIKNTAIVMSNVLDRYVSYFPQYTDHSSLHSLQVIDFCNKMIGDQIDMLNADEILVLLFACYFHDTGMGISEKDYAQLHDKIISKDYMAKHPGISIQEQIRSFHQEFSAGFIRKYASLFEIPSEEHIEAIIQVSRGHRLTNLNDPEGYPSDFKVPNGNTICLPYLASLIRLADELDIASDRNVFFENYDPNNLEHVKHQSIQHMEMTENSFDLTVKRHEDVEINDYIDLAIQKLQYTLEYCSDVCSKRTKFRIKQTIVNTIEV